MECIVLSSVDWGNDSDIVVAISSGLSTIVLIVNCVIIWKMGEQNKLLREQNEITKSLARLEVLPTFSVEKTRKGNGNTDWIFELKNNGGPAKNVRTPEVKVPFTHTKYLRPRVIFQEQTLILTLVYDSDKPYDWSKDYSIRIQFENIFGEGFYQIISFSSVLAITISEVHEG